VFSFFPGYDDGRLALLVCLYGTIPISYRGRIYNIPINIWIPHTYPHTSPFVFVTPTETMVIKESKNVDLTGKVHLPYLHYWPSRPDQCNLLELARVLGVVFGQQPPVYHKPSSATKLIKTSPPLATSTTNDVTTTSHTSIERLSDISHPLVSAASPSTTSSKSLYPSLQQPVMAAADDMASLQLAIFQKIQQQLQTVERTKTQEMEHLLRINAQLKENTQKLTQGITLLDQKIYKMDRESESLRQNILDMKNMVTISEAEQEVDIDEIALTNHVIHRQ
jgi:ESCRT-I complex subunit TSG101